MLRFSGHPTILETPFEKWQVISLIIILNIKLLPWFKYLSIRDISSLRGIVLNVYRLVKIYV